MECRESPCRRCWESVAPRYTSGAVSRTVRVVGGDDGVEEKDGKVRCCVLSVRVVVCIRIGGILT